MRIKEEGWRCLVWIWQLTKLLEKEVAILSALDGGLGHATEVSTGRPFVLSLVAGPVITGGKRRCGHNTAGFLTNGTTIGAQGELGSRTYVPRSTTGEGMAIR
jgi:hypothetical protein